jgi:hypothetical protein
LWLYQTVMTHLNGVAKRSVEGPASIDVARFQKARYPAPEARGCVLSGQSQTVSVRHGKDCRALKRLGSLVNGEAVCSEVIVE